MLARSLIKILLVLVALAAVGQAEAEELLLSCDDDAYVSYSEPTAVPLKGRVIVHKINKQTFTVKKERDSVYKPYSPQRTAAFNRVLVADTTKAGTRNNVIQFFTLQGPRYAWQMEIHDVMENASIEWLNEDIVFVRVWWGRIVSTDLVFQLSTGRFLYSQEANYGALVQPCK